jgi:hypothetical protein
MGTFQSGTEAARTSREGQITLGESTSPSDGFLEQSRHFLLGGRASSWLRKNEDAAFSLADSCLESASNTQAALQAILDDAACGIYPKVSVMREGEYVEEDISKLAFAQKVAALTVECMTAVDKALTIRNKVATGGTNILTAALMGSNAMQFAAARKERVAGVKRRVGVDAIPEGVIDV